MMAVATTLATRGDIDQFAEPALPRATRTSGVGRRGFEPLTPCASCKKSLCRLVRAVSGSTSEQGLLRSGVRWMALSTLLCSAVRDQNVIIACARTLAGRVGLVRRRQASRPSLQLRRCRERSGVHRCQRRGRTAPARPRSSSSSVRSGSTPTACRSARLEGGRRPTVRPWSVPLESKRLRAPAERRACSLLACWGRHLLWSRRPSAGRIGAPGPRSDRASGPVV